ncbi:MAG: hypothetical protein LUC83_04305 [Clostridiales bacterium]|nr:hypothetical protein [Clostridiales bacterium]
MDKYEYKLKLDQLKSLVETGDYETAAEIAGSINWRKVRNSKTLLMVAEVYERLGRYEECKEVLLQAYDHSSVGRSIVSRLAEVAIKARDVEEAESYYQEFLEISPKDNQRYILAYEISCLKDAPLSDRIAILEELKEKEYMEKWAYELAALYQQADMREKCVETCDELILWFGEGEYVEKALDLKRSFQPLTPAQEEKYQQFRSKKGMVEINIPKKVEARISEDSGLPELTVTASKFNTVNLQEELARSMRQIIDATERETVRDSMDTIKKIVSDIPYLSGETDEEETPAQHHEKINEEVDETLRADFKELLEEDGDGQMSMHVPENTAQEQQVSGQMSIEEVLAEWEKTKRAAEAAIAAAEQKKLDMEKEQALAEASEIMERLKALLPVLSATPGEDLPEEPETVASTLIPEAAEAAPKQEESGEQEDAAEEPADEEPATMPDESEAEEPENLAALIESEQQEETPAQNAGADSDRTSEQSTDADSDTGFTQTGEESAEGEEEDEIAGEMASEVSRMMEMSEEEAGDVQPDDEFANTDGADAVPEEDMSDKAAADTIELPHIDLSEDLLDDVQGISEPDAPEEKPMGGLTEEEIRELFTYFLPVPGMREQIMAVLEDAANYKGNSITSLRGNLIVQGEEGSGKTVLAASLIRAIQKITGKENRKIGKISAAALNKKDFAALVPKLEGGYLIVDKAGDLTARTVTRMSQIMERNTRGMVIILEDDSAGIKKVMGLDFSFAKKFTGKVKIPVFTIDELVDFGKAYALEMECVIDEMGVLAMYNRINNIQKLEHPTTLTEVKEIIDQAIESAESGGLKKIFAKKYDENDYLILRETDFE